MCYPQPLSAPTTILILPSDQEEFVPSVEGGLNEQNIVGRTAAANNTQVTMRHPCPSQFERQEQVGELLMLQDIWCQENVTI